MKLASLLVEDLICTHAKASSYDEAKSLLLKTLAKEEDGIDAAALTQALAERESLTTTVIAPGIGFPHARSEAIPDFYILIGCFPDGFPVEGQAVPVRFVVVFLLPEGMSNLYLGSVSAFAKLLAAPGGLDHLVGAGSPGELIEWIESKGAMVKDTVTAADIMSKNPPALKVDDTLRAAADMMVKHNRWLLPVVDDAGIYLGAVSADMLLKVGLPDYLLQMESVGFLTNFEPFQDLLKEEQRMTVREIMDQETPVFTHHTPMIIVAGKLVRDKINTGVIVDEGKLVGLISGLDFVHKVVRV